MKLKNELSNIEFNMSVFGQWSRGFPFGNLVFLPPQKPSFQIPVQLWKGTEMNEWIIASFQNISFTFIFLTYHLQVSPVPSHHTQAAPTIHLQN